ncbi:predicted protein [Sclerotinia sclerotiorum 1980 UF-70]|uniref:Uncharacterized protein n=1 Tax=Sclerotinia sclerotiorum (strain ATCC 18683 / 1980 / Ss-1) TaxID=665079 RepID=A7F7G7_SCLS1|nr:predicted protein [Sclerotinia sclerotiorum 1980 UF-70]EDN98688.1 predicted protein [Sclerotinia sclerotiorum 1980 UF-70]
MDGLDSNLSMIQRNRMIDTWYGSYDSRVKLAELIRNFKHVAGLSPHVLGEEEHGSWNIAKPE